MYHEHTARDIAHFTPDQCWDRYVGQQPVDDFLDSAGAHSLGDVTITITDYVERCPLSADLDQAARSELVAQLLRKVQVDLAEKAEPRPDDGFEAVKAQLVDSLLHRAGAFNLWTTSLKLARATGRPGRLAKLLQLWTGEAWADCVAVAQAAIDSDG